jgi:hypothetical protein
MCNSEKPESLEGEFEVDRTPSQTSCIFNRLKVSCLASILWHFLSNSLFFHTACHLASLQAGVHTAVDR